MFCLCLHDGSIFYAYPVYIPMASSFPGSRPNESILWLKVLLDSRL